MYRSLPSAIVLVSVLIRPAPAPAQMAVTPEPQPDQTAPVIQQQPPQWPAAAGDSIVISATITDDYGVQQAVIYYRKRGREAYLLTMMAHAGENVYRATLPAELIGGGGLEYYLEAKDGSGNTARRGAAATPLIIVAGTPGPAPPAQVETDDAAPQPTDGLRTEAGASEQSWYQKWWVWTLAGVVVAGVAAAAAGGGDGGGDGGGGEPTGAAEIRAPTP